MFWYQCNQFHFFSFLNFNVIYVVFLNIFTFDTLDERISSLAGSWFHWFITYFGVVVFTIIIASIFIEHHQTSFLEFVADFWKETKIYFPRIAILRTDIIKNGLFSLCWDTMESLSSQSLWMLSACWEL